MSDTTAARPNHDDDRHPLEAIATDYAQSLRCGHRGAIEPVVQANEQHDSELRDLLPVIQVLEQARKRQTQRPGGLASLGSSRPTRLGDYELVRQIGRGGMGVVFEAVQESLGRKVALKVLPKSLLEDQQQLDRFEREARTAGSLHHTNIVPVFGVGSDQGFHYYVMQRIEGSGLDRVLAEREEPFTPREVARLGLQAASALAHAHEQGVLHRDIKPANLIVNDQQDLWVTDFGVAKAIEEETQSTGEVVGTLRYMAPEQVRGELDPRSDIYSLGCTLYELLAGRPALDDPTIRQSIVAARPAQTSGRVRYYDKSVPRDFEAILEASMASDPAERYVTADEMAGDLRRFLADEPIRILPPTRPQLMWRWAKRNPALAMLSAATLSLLIGVAALAWGRAELARRTLETESRLRTDAEETAEIASGALDKIFQRFAIAGDNASTLTAISSAPTLSNEAAELLQELIRYYDDLAARGDFDPQLNRAAGEARYSIGTIYHQLGQYEKAVDAFESARKHFAADKSEHEDGGLNLDFIVREAELSNRIGFAWRMLGEDEKADEIHFQALERLTAKGVFQASDKVWFQEGQSHFALARRLRPGMGPETTPPVSILMFLKGGKGPAGDSIRREYNRAQYDPRRQHHLTRASQIFRDLYEANPQHIGYARWFAATLSDLRSDSLVGASRHQLAAENEASEILEQLHRQYPDNQVIEFDLANSLGQLSVFEPRLARTQLEWGIDRVEEAVKHCEALAAAHPNVPAYLNTCAHTHFKLGVLLQRYGDLLWDRNDPDARQMYLDAKQQAGFSFRAAMRHQTMLERQHPNAIGYKSWNALFIHFYGELLLQIERFDDAERTFARAARHWHRINGQHPEQSLALFGLAEAELTLAEIESRR